MILNGFIPLYRKEMECSWYKDMKVKNVYIHILLNANFKENTYEGRTILPGQHILSPEKFGKEIGLSRQEVRTALNKLKKWGEITIETTNRYTIVTVVKWQEYQISNYYSTNNLTINQPTVNQQSTINQPHLNNEKKEKKVKKEKNNIGDAGASCEAKQPKRQVYYPLDAKLNQAMIDFVEYRKKIKAPMTDRAVDLMIGKLDSMTADNNEKIAILEQSIVNGWKGVFPLRNENTKKADDNDFFRMAERVAKEEGVDLF